MCTCHQTRTRRVYKCDHVHASQVVIDTAAWVSNLPHTLEAIFFVKGSYGALLPLSSPSVALRAVRSNLQPTWNVQPHMSITARRAYNNS